MKTPRLLLIIGNGLAMDAEQNFEPLHNNATCRRPLGFRDKLFVPDAPRIPLMKMFKQLSVEIEEHLKVHPDYDQFEIIRLIEEMAWRYPELWGNDHAKSIRPLQTVWCR
jgi:hypothetical protein